MQWKHIDQAHAQITIEKGKIKPFKTGKLLVIETRDFPPG